MHPALRAAYRAERAAASAAESEGRIALAFHHLERAHVLSQRHAWAHARVHFEMLRLGASQRDAREVAGQVVRIAAAALFSRIWVPLGNTGRARVGAMRPMPVPPDLREVLACGDTRPSAEEPSTWRS